MDLCEDECEMMPLALHIVNVAAAVTVAMAMPVTKKSE